MAEGGECPWSAYCDVQSEYYEACIDDDHDNIQNHSSIKVNSTSDDKDDYEPVGMKH